MGNLERACGMGLIECEGVWKGGEGAWEGLRGAFYDYELVWNGMRRLE